MRKLPTRCASARSRAARECSQRRRPTIRSCERWSRAADQFIVRRGERKTVIAGYHWFSDWGRDTMIALPGLTLATGRFDVAREILLAFAASVDRGMLPNRFPDAGETPEYNTVDATLWFFEAVRAYAAHTRRRRLRPRETLRRAGGHHRLARARHALRHPRGRRRPAAGRRARRAAHLDGRQGRRLGGHAAHGKPVEIQALWYNALRIMAGSGRRFGDADAAHDSGSPTGRATASARSSGTKRPAVSTTWSTADGRDGAIRPNQIFAVSLFHSDAAATNRRAASSTRCERHLLTPYGLRSLAPVRPAVSRPLRRRRPRAATAPIIRARSGRG